MRPESAGSRALAGVRLSVLGMLGACAGAPATPDAVPRWTVEPELRIGGLDAGAAAFSHIVGVSVDGEGRIYVAQWREPVLRVFDARGRHVQDIGRPGAGPGEFAQPGAPAVRGDTLWIPDALQRRTHLFLRDGSFVRTLTLPPAPGARSVAIPDFVEPLADGAVLARYRAPSARARPGPRVRPIVRMARDGTHADTLLVQHVADIELFVRFGETGGALTTHPTPDLHVAVVTADGGGILVLDAPAPRAAADARFRLVRLGPEGDTVFVRGIAYEPVPVRPDFIEAEIERLTTMFSAHEETPREAVRRAVGAALVLPPFLPPVSRLVVGRDESIWLRREATLDSTIAWWVLDPAGERLADAVLPAGLTVHAADAAHVWGVETDDLGVEYVVRYRIRPLSGRAARGRAGRVRCRRAPG